MSTDICPSCGRFTPAERIICPYCPTSARVAQGIGAALALVLGMAFIAGILLLGYFFLGFIGV